MYSLPRVLWGGSISFSIVIKQVLCDQIILDYLKNIYFFFLHIRGAVIVFLSIIITSDICITFFYIICLQ